MHIVGAEMLGTVFCVKFTSALSGMHEDGPQVAILLWGCPLPLSP